MSDGAAVWIYVVLAVANFALQDWKTVKAIFSWFWNGLRWTVVGIWHWSATWSWEAVCSIGWLGMLAVNEYAIGLCLLSAAALGAISKLLHWKPLDYSRVPRKALGMLAIPVAFILAVLMTLANKRDKPWSPTKDWIDAYMATSVPLPIPAFPQFSLTLPPPLGISHTDPATMAILEQEIRVQKRILAAPAPSSDKARFEASFWPSLITEWPIHRKTMPLVNGVVSVTLTFMARDHMAKQAVMWLRLCRGCAYAKEPAGFQNLNAHPLSRADEPNERLLVVGDLLPNVAFAPIIAMDVIPPPNEDHFDIGVQVGCENCDPIDPKEFQVLRVDMQR
jgi:hypothetical protein